jgi:hypothetical protein
MAGFQRAVVRESVTIDDIENASKILAPRHKISMLRATNPGMVISGSACAGAAVIARPLPIEELSP